MPRGTLILNSNLCTTATFEWQRIDWLSLILKAPEMKLVEFANKEGLEKVAHNEQPHLDLHCFALKSLDS